MLNIVYEPKNFDSLLHKGLSDQLLKNHFMLYQSYVTNTNKIADALNVMLKEGKTGTQEYAYPRETGNNIGKNLRPGTCKIRVLIGAFNVNEGMLFDQLPNNRARCNVCSHRCNIGEGNIGICGTRKNISGKVHSIIYNTVSSEAVDQIEKKPLYHFLPGTLSSLLAL